MFAPYHWKNGWHFWGNANGSVTIEHRVYQIEEGTGKQTNTYTIDQKINIDIDSWASIVASVSAHGDTREAWNAAKRFHAGESNIWFMDEQDKMETN